MGSEILNATPMRRVRIALSFGLLLMISSLVLLERGINHRWAGGTFQTRGYQITQAAGLLLLAGSTLVIVLSAIYGSLKLVVSVAAAAGIASLAIAAVFFYMWFISLEEGITLRNWTLALSVPGFVWLAAGAIFLLMAGLRFILSKVRGQDQQA